MKSLKKSEGKFGIEGSPRGDNLFIWVRLSCSDYIFVKFNAHIPKHKTQGGAIICTNVLVFQIFSVHKGIF